jgi:hypothetical protein
VKIDDRSMERIYHVFRRKMMEVYRGNFEPDPFGNSMILEFNAWQSYLRDSLSLNVVDIELGDSPGLADSPTMGRVLRIENPSNGTGHSKEFIVIPLDLAEKIILLDALPDRL